MAQAVAIPATEESKGEDAATALGEARTVDSKATRQLAIELTGTFLLSVTSDGHFDRTLPSLDGPDI